MSYTTSMYDEVGARLAALEQGQKLRRWLTHKECNLSQRARVVAEALVLLCEESGSLSVTVSLGVLTDMTGLTRKTVSGALNADLVGNHLLDKVDLRGQRHTLTLRPPWMEEFTGVAAPLSLEINEPSSKFHENSSSVAPISVVPSSMSKSSQNTSDGRS